jgi:MerR family transcriptional regulator, light-induced transcriptional regulator
MSAPVLERRPLYGIGTVARLTGVKPDTLRVWERRYGLGASHKSASGRRQYTQGDLEHLQLVAALVAGGARIGEIASAGRKTLEALLSNGSRHGARLPDGKPRVVFLGATLCDWLQDHQGCLAGADALLLRSGPDAIPAELSEELQGCDVLIVFAPGPSRAAVANALSLQRALAAQRVILTCEFSSQGADDQARDSGLVVLPFPPEPARLAFEISRCAAEKVVRQGHGNVGELVQPRPREFGPRELAAALTLQHALDCECPRHVAQLVESLANFEQYSADCSAENWRDAAVHARVYAFAAQSRWLMERALQALLEEHGEAFAAALDGVRDADTLGDDGSGSVRTLQRV